MRPPSIPGIARSAPYCASPVTFGTPSGRIGRVPTHLNCFTVWREVMSSTVTSPDCRVAVGFARESRGRRANASASAEGLAMRLRAVAKIVLRPWPPERPPVKTAGSFCPCASILFDYIRGDGAKPGRDGAQPAADSLRTGNLTGNFSGVFRRSGILARNSARFTRGRPAARCTLRCGGMPPAATRSARRRCPAAGRRRRRPPRSGRDPRRGRRRGHGWGGAVFWRRGRVRRRRHGRAGGVAPGFIALACFVFFVALAGLIGVAAFVFYAAFADLVGFIVDISLVVLAKGLQELKVLDSF